jgi:Ser/Thr protein kinase RdoA (MazF antagonist)
VLSGDAGLVGIRWLLGPSPRHVLRRELATMLGDPRLLGPCRLRRVKFKPGRKVTAYYEAALRDPLGRPRGSRPIAVTWTADGGVQQRPPKPAGSELEAEIAGRGLAAPFRTLEATVSGWGMHVLVSPVDTRFPHLARLSDPKFVARAVRGAGCRVTPIRYRPGQRHVLRYDLERPDGSRETIFAKLYEDGRGERTCEVARRVADWLATNGSGAAAVRPISYLGDSRTVLYPALAGGPLSQLLGRRYGNGAEQLRRAGSLLRTLHSAPLEVAGQRDPYELAGEVSAVARATEHVQMLMPGAAQRIAAILDRARELNDRLPRERQTLVHGDCKLDHLWPAREGLTLIDLDRSGIGDPALDIGKLLADLGWWHLIADRPGLTQAREDLLDGYGAVASSPRVRRARVYEAVLLVKIAARRVALFDRRWPMLTETLIARGERTLADVERECGAGGASGSRRPTRLRSMARSTSVAPPIRLSV